MSDSQFGALTPRQFHLLMDRHQEQIEHGKMLTGLLASTFANFSFSPPKKPLGPMDFFGGSKKQRVNRKAEMERSINVLMAMSKKA